jgi:hypothetical protein
VPPPRRKAVSEITIEFLSSFPEHLQKEIVGQGIVELIRHDFPDDAREIANRILNEDHKLAILALMRDESLLRERATGIRNVLAGGAAAAAPNAAVAASSSGAAAAEANWWEGWDARWSSDQWASWESRPGWSGSDSNWQDAYPREPAPRGTVDEEFRWGNASWR